MVVEVIVEFFIWVVLDVMLQILGYLTAYLCLPVLTLGYVKVAPVDKGVKVYPKWHGFNRDKQGKWVLHEETGALVGIVFWMAVIGLGLYLYICY